MGPLAPAERSAPAEARPDNLPVTSVDTVAIAEIALVGDVTADGRVLEVA